MDRFSPYLDPEPIADIFDDFALRNLAAMAVAAMVHIGFFIALHSSYRVPNVPDEPVPLNIQIIAAVEDKPEPVIVPKPKARQAKKPQPAAKPEPKPIAKQDITPKPQPVIQPRPEPIPAPAPQPQPQPQPQPIIAEPPTQAQPKPAPTPPIQKTITPRPQPTPQAPQTLFVPDVEQPIPVPEITIEPSVNSIPEQLDQTAQPQEFPSQIPDITLPQPQPNTIPDIRPSPALTPVQEPDFQDAPMNEVPSLGEPVFSPPTPEPMVSEPIQPPDNAPQAVVLDPLLEPDAPLQPSYDVTAMPEAVPEIIFEPTIPPSTTPDIPQQVPADITAIAEPDMPEFYAPSPSILASPQAPISPSEIELAIPKSQAAQPERQNPYRDDDIVQTGRRPVGGKPRTNPYGRPEGIAKKNPYARPGGGSSPLSTNQQPRTSRTPNGGRRNGNPGAKGWTLDPADYPDQTSPEYKAMMRDIRCREKDRTHADCPNYVPDYKGRNIKGYESFDPHAPRGTNVSRPSARAGTENNPAIGGSTSPTGANRDGWSMDTSGRPSTSILDEADFGRTYRGTHIGDGQNSGNRVRDVFDNSDPAPWTQQENLPTAPDEQPDSGTEILEP